MAANEPPYLPIGTDVSAKYRGAFCEAKVKKIAKSVKCKVFVKEIQSSLHVADEFVTGPLLVGGVVEVRHPDTGWVMEGTISKMFDSSMYTVVFDDGDERTLRRTQLCLKGDKHFIESETLDNLPLSNPEHFGTPVISGKGKRNRSSTGTGNQDESDGSSDDEDSDSHQELLGKVMFYDAGEKKRSYLLPVLVVTPEAHPVTHKTKDHLLVKSFKDNKFLSVLKKELIPFRRVTVLKNEDKTLKVPMEKALLYIDNRELPPTWNKDELLGPDYESDFIDDKSSDDNEPSEEEDRFVAQLYKFCDDRGTPINKAPSVGSKDLNLYKLFKIVQKLGGYNRVTNQMKWRLVYSKMLLPPSNTASTQIKNAYKKYLHAFEDFYRKLGSTMGTISRPGRSRHDSGRGILNFRGRDKELVAKESAKEKASKEGATKESKETGAKDMLNKEVGNKEAVTKDTPAKTTVKTEEKTPDTNKDEKKDEKPTDKKEVKSTDKKDEKSTELETENEQVSSVASTPVGTPKRPKSARLKAEVRLIKENPEKVTKDEKKDKKEVKKSETKVVKKTEEDSSTTKSDVKADEGKKVKDDLKKDKEEVKKVKDEGKKDKDELKKDKEDGKKEKEGKDEDKKEKEGKKEAEKKGEKKDGVKTKVLKKEVEESKEPKELKKLGRRRIATRFEDEPEVKKEKRELVEVKDKRSEQKDKEVNKEPQKTGDKEEKKTLKKDAAQKAMVKKEDKNDKNDDGDVAAAPSNSGPADLPVGTKMRVRYGRGRNQREYEAKILELGGETGPCQYLVHYAGWNTRHDEWIRPERIVKVLEKPDQKIKAVLKPSPKLLKKPIKTKLLDKAPASPSSVTSTESGPTPGRGRPPGKLKSPATASTPTLASKGRPRPTRSNSVEQIVIKGLLPKRRPKKSLEKTESPKGNKDINKSLDKFEFQAEATLDCGVIEGLEKEVWTYNGRSVVSTPAPSFFNGSSSFLQVTRTYIKAWMSLNLGQIPSLAKELASLEHLENVVSSDSESEESDESDAEEEIDVEIEKKEPAKNTMPSIANTPLIDKTTDDLEVDTSIDRSPPQLSKMTDIVKDKVEEEGKEEVKPDLKENDETAPILNVVEHEKDNEPILQKMEAQLIASSPPSFVKVDNKDKDTKKTETLDKKNKKPLFKLEGEDNVKKLEKVLETTKVPPVVSKFTEESPYEFKDEADIEPEYHRDRKKPVVLMEDCRKESPRKDSPRKESPRRTWHDNDGANLLQKIEKEEVGIVPLVKNMTDAKDFSKSDSEVERRGRKKKEVKEKEVKENFRRAKVLQMEKTVTETKESASPERSKPKSLASPERRAFITLAEKKQVYSLFVKNSDEPQHEMVNTDTLKPEKDKDTEKKETKEQKKQIDSVVVHTAIDTVQTIDIEVKHDNVAESVENMDLLTPSTVKEELIPLPVVEKKSDATESEKKKVRKKTKKKLNSEELQDLYGPKKKIGGRRRRNLDNLEKDNLEKIANAENKLDIDLRCDEKIRSRSASPESKKPNINIQDTQGFGPLFEAVECKLKESQQSQESAMTREYKSTPFKGNLFENTPPSTPEHDSDGASQNSQERVKMHVSANALETNSKLGVTQPVGSESPWGIGNTSPSSGSSGVVAGSEGSIDVSILPPKRRRESDEPTPTKRRKRISRNKSYNRLKGAESDSEDASNLSVKCRSPHYSSDSYTSRTTNHANRNRSPRPPKYNFNLEEGKYLEGNERISFLVDKVQEIRKIYMSLKAEVACIDRRRKRARRRERESGRTGSSGEVDYL